MVAQFQAVASAAQLDVLAIGDELPVLGQTVRQHLRHATLAVHETLHAHPGFVSLSEGRMTFPGYRALLARLHGFHWPLERGLRAASPGVLRGFNVRARERSFDLRADLRALGMSGSEIDALPACEGLPPIRSHAELMGRLYVVEGSALGGRVMASRLDGILGSDRAGGRRFLAGRAAPDPLPWPAFCRMLEAAEAAQIHALIESAETTFRVLAEWLTESEIHV